MPSQSNAVVASLAEQSQTPFSSLAMSPNRQYAVIAGKDNLQLVRVNSNGIKSLRKLKISQHFQGSAGASTDRNPHGGKVYGDVRDAFNLSANKSAHSHARANMAHGNVVVTCVAWSMPQTKSGVDEENDDAKSDTIIAAAGSNGNVVVWSARQAFFSDGSGESSTLANQQPESILHQHTRSVNNLAWHPKRPGLLLTASQVSFLFP